jgi:hypothetical protein
MTNTNEITAYTVVAREMDSDEGSRMWLRVTAASPSAAVAPAKLAANKQGYGVGATLYDVYDGAVEGTTLGHTPLHREERA